MIGIINVIFTVNDFFLVYTVTCDFPVFSLKKPQKVNDARNQFNSVTSALITFRAECHVRPVEACGPWYALGQRPSPHWGFLLD